MQCPEIKLRSDETQVRRFADFGPRCLEQNSATALNGENLYRKSRSLVKKSKSNFIATLNIINTKLQLIKIVL